eukprot:427025-Ditylum_brightwellii.AAC.1
MVFEPVEPALHIDQPLQQNDNSVLLRRFARLRENARRAKESLKVQDVVSPPNCMISRWRLNIKLHKK